MVTYLMEAACHPRADRQSINAETVAQQLRAAVVTVSCDRAGEGYSKQSYSRYLLGAAEAEGEQRQSLG
jgi:hypothetical protein